MTTHKAVSAAKTDVRKIKLSTMGLLIFSLLIVATSFYWMPMNNANGQAAPTSTTCTPSSFAGCPSTSTSATQSCPVGAVCSTGTTNTTKQCPPTAPCDFTLSITSPPNVTVLQGSSNSTITTVTSTGSFSSPVSLSYTGAPAGLTITFSPNPAPLSPGGPVAVLTSIVAAATATPGIYAIIITGTGGALSHSAGLWVSVQTPTPASHTTTNSTTLPSLTQSISLSTLMNVYSCDQTVSATATVNTNNMNPPVGGVIQFTVLGPAPSNATFATGDSCKSSQEEESCISWTMVPGGFVGRAVFNFTAPCQAGTYEITASALFGPNIGSVATTSFSVPQGGQTVFSLSTTTPISTVVTSVSNYTGPDFQISFVPNHKTMSIGGTDSVMVSVESLAGFSGLVALSLPLPPPSSTGISLTLSTNTVTLSSGGQATAYVTIITSSHATTGNYLAYVRGTSGQLTHADVLYLIISPAVAGPQCLIATAAYGSSAAPEVQLLRNFRDASIDRTKAGSAFMVAFNAWYYSFSPPVATYLNTHWAERTAMKGTLYPLIGILWLSSRIFDAIPQPELAVLLSGLLASGLIGAFYLGLPIELLEFKLRKKNATQLRRTVRVLCSLLLSGLILLLPSEITGSWLLMIGSTVTIVLSNLLLCAFLMASCVRKMLGTRIFVRRLK